MTLYGPDLSHIHHVGFGTFAERAAPWLLELVRQVGVESGLIVDLGCGSGIWARRATEAGFRVLGVDVSPAMIELARANAPRASFIVGSAHAVALPTCIAVTALGEGISYLWDRSDELDVANLVSRVAEALVPGGVFVFDVVQRTPNAPMNYRSSREGDDWTVTVEVEEDPVRSLLTRTIRVSRELPSGPRHTVETHWLRTFDPEEMRDVLESAGFSARTTRTYGALELPPRRLGFVAYKQRNA